MNKCSAALWFLGLAVPGFAWGQPARFAPTPPAERLVGIAYTTWHTSTNWNNVWGTPVLGHYKSDDRTVIRQHAEWLADAGVDFIWIGWSNDVNYFPGESQPRKDFDMIENSTRAIFEEYAQLKRRPQISVFLGVTGAPAAVTDGRLQRKADQLHRWFAADPRYRPLMQEHLGKPLLVVYVDTPAPFQRGVPPWNDPRFTVRWMTGYVTEQGNLRAPDRISKFGYWSWEDRGPQTFPILNERPESMVVVASWRPQAKPGDKGYLPAGPRNQGQTFRDQWARARQIGPQFAMVVSWNEWVKGEQPSAEISKDIEPSREFGRFYLEQCPAGHCRTSAELPRWRRWRPWLARISWRQRVEGKATVAAGPSGFRVQAPQPGRLK